uniref:Uncharacterized protein n=1 Tax=Ditylenchus dipsaci TaxID=166011 RepID=A0A915CXA2_9BILA
MPTTFVALAIEMLYLFYLYLFEEKERMLHCVGTGSTPFHYSIPIDHRWRGVGYGGSSLPMKTNINNYYLDFTVNLEGKLEDECGSISRLEVSTPVVKPSAEVLAVEAPFLLKIRLHTMNQQPLDGAVLEQLHRQLEAKREGKIITITIGDGDTMKSIRIEHDPQRQSMYSWVLEAGSELIKVDDLC